MKKNIFFFISNLDYGGATNAIINFSKNLNKNKYNLFIICINKRNNIKIPKHVKLYQFDSYKFIFKTFFNFFSVKNLILTKFKNETNIFISNIHYSNIISIIFLRKIKHLKIIVFERTSLKELDIYHNLINFIKKKIIKNLIKYLYCKTDLVLTNSKLVSNEFKSLNISTNVVYSGTLNKIRSYKKKNINFKKNYNLISVGRLSYQKDYFTILNALKILKKNKHFNLKIYGTGELKNTLKKFVIENNLKEVVIFCGNVTDKNKIFKNADLLIHGAIFEGLPNSLVDSINYGVPIIAANGYGGIKEVLGNGKYGDLFISQDYYQLSKKITHFFRNPKRLNVKIVKGREILNNFVAKKTSKKLDIIISKLHE